MIVGKIPGKLQKAVIGMRNILLFAVMLCLLVLMDAAAALAVATINFGGNYQLTYLSADGKYELSFPTTDIECTEPEDGIVERISIGELYFDPAIGDDYDTDEDGVLDTAVYYFDPSENPDGFQVYDSNGIKLFQADMEIEQLAVTSLLDAGWNDFLTAILYNFEYVSGSSPITDFIMEGQVGEGSLFITISGGGLYNAIKNLQNKTGGEGGYTELPAPEPSTLVFLALGLVGLGTVFRKRHE